MIEFKKGEGDWLILRIQELDDQPAHTFAVKREAALRLYSELSAALGYETETVHPVEISGGFEAQPWDSEAVIKARQHEALWSLTKQLPAEFTQEPGPMSKTLYRAKVRFLPYAKD